MKYIHLLPALLIILVSCRSEENASENKQADNSKPVIEFSELEHDFGKIVEGEVVACVFTFRNEGNTDLIISSATTSCGCTVPDFEDAPVPPGEKGNVEVAFDSSYREGVQNKTITIRSNADKPVVILKIKAEVITSN